MREVTALLCEVDKTEKLEMKVKEKEDEFSRLRNSFNLLRNRYEQHLKDNDVLTRDFRQSGARLNEVEENKQLTRANEWAPEFPYAILQPFADANC